MRWNVGVVSLALLAGMSCAGCSGKKSVPLDGGGGSAGGLEESDLGAQGSLAEAQAGTFGSGGDAGSLQDIHFAYDSFDLDETARGILRRNADWLIENSTARVEIEGHCDERGTIEYNVALGARRAGSAKSYLVALGVDPTHITTISYGEELPLCRESTPECWRRNRRG